eukprot:TRINITY_DN42909_c0_g1_i1.p1 TRINITY_DN42909_c0_g1~~TRINITY_DN42909_c0_g1_i1.p1  ORF type:complete len:331 (-),score=94.29 TRINITY_DN42909_c0_g1_i1:119-1111(-)
MVKQDRGLRNPDEHALPLLSGAELQEELCRLRAEYEALETEEAEQDASNGVLLNDAFLQRLQLCGVLQRHRDSQPKPEDLAEKQRAALDDLAEEVVQLKEENSLLATKVGLDSGTEDHTTSVSSRSSRVRSAGEELHEEVSKLRRSFTASRRREWQSWLEEWRLVACKSEARQVIREMKQQESELKALKQEVVARKETLRDVQQKVVAGQLEAEAEQSLIRDLNREVLSTREACFIPARLKRDTSFLRKIFDQEGARLKTRRHMRSLDACKKLYDEVAARAPSMLPLASRVKLEMENQFSRYLQLEEGHNRALQRLHLSFTRGLLQKAGQ